MSPLRNSGEISKNEMQDQIPDPANTTLIGKPSINGSFPMAMLNNRMIKFRIKNTTFVISIGSFRNTLMVAPGWIAFAQDHDLLLQDGARKSPGFLRRIFLGEIREIISKNGGFS